MWTRTKSRAFPAHVLGASCTAPCSTPADWPRRSTNFCRIIRVAKAIPGRPARGGKATPVCPWNSSCGRSRRRTGGNLRFAGLRSTRARNNGDPFSSTASLYWLRVYPDSRNVPVISLSTAALLLRRALGPVLLDAPLAPLLVGGLQAALFLGLVAYVGIDVAAEFYRHRGGEQVEPLAEHVGEITFVGLRHVRRLAAVHHYARRVASALVGVTQPDAPAAHDGRLVLHHRGLHGAGQLLGLHLAHRRLVGADHGSHQLADTGAMARTDEVHRCERHEVDLERQQPPDLLALLHG